MRCSYGSVVCVSECVMDLINKLLTGTSESPEWGKKKKEGKNEKIVMENKKKKSLWRMNIYRLTYVYYSSPMEQRGSLRITRNMMSAVHSIIYFSAGAISLVITPHIHRLCCRCCGFATALGNGGWNY